MTAEKFKSICEYKGITWNDLVRIRIIRKKFDMPMPDESKE